MNDIHGLGHNRPPGDAIGRAAELVQNCNRWITERPAITDREMAGAAQEFLVQLRKASAELDTEMKVEREPYDALVAKIRMRYRDPAQLVGLCLDHMRRLLAPWLKAEDDRLEAEADQRHLDAEAAERRAERAADAALQPGAGIEAQLAVQRASEEAEAAAKLAAKPVERAQVKGDLAAKAISNVSFWHAEVTEPKKAIRFFAKQPEIDPAIVKAMTQVASRMARELKDPSKAPPGIRFVSKEVPR